MADVASDGGDAAPKSGTPTMRPESSRVALVASQAVPWLASGLLLAAVFAVYGPSLKAPFLFDDSASVVDNRSIRQLSPLWGGLSGTTPLSPPKEMPTAARPVVNLSLALNYYFGELDPFGYHLVNLVIHALATLLLWALVRDTLRLEYFQGRFDRAAEMLAFLVALIWAVHPLVTESVQYVTQRTESMMGMFYLATMYGSARYLTTPAGRMRKAWWALAVAACWLGMGCKEVMVTAPFMVLCYDRTFLAGSFRKALQASWGLYLGLFASWLPLAWLSYGMPHSESAGFSTEVPAYAWWLTQAKVLEMYLKLTFWPWPLVIHYQLPLVLNPMGVWPSLLVVAILAVNIAMMFWQRGAIGFLGVWVFVILSPTLVIPILAEIAAERRMYLPLAAIVALVVVGGYALVQTALAPKKPGAPPGRAPLWPLAITGGAALIAACVLAIVSTRRLAHYDSSLAMFQDAAVHQPDNFLVLSNLAYALLLEGREEEANEYYLRARPMNPAALERHWGLALVKAGQPQKAIQHFEEANRLKPRAVENLQSLGVALVNSGQQRQAVEPLKEAVRLAPDAIEPRRYLAIALTDSGRPQEAIRHLQHALALVPGSAELKQELARAENGVRTAREIERLRRELAIQPNSAQLYYDLGSVLLGGGQTEAAIAALEQALQLQPDFPAAKRKLDEAEQARKR